VAGNESTDTSLLTWSEALDILEQDYRPASNALSLLRQLTEGAIANVKLDTNERLQYVGPDAYELVPLMIPTTTTGDTYG
jgi:hypothetical protein